jgi:hypothetical protein
MFENEYYGTIASSTFGCPIYIYIYIYIKIPLWFIEEMGLKIKDIINVN